MIRVFYFMVLVLMLSACSKNLIPYSEYLQEKHHWSEHDIEQIQFYTSKDIVLYRDAADSDTQIINGSVKIRSGRQVDEVVIRAGTPGVAIWQSDDQRYGISFETDDNSFLTFGINPEKNKRYYLLASDWKGKIGTVTYNGENYKASASSSDAYLLIDLKKTKNLQVRSRTAKGRTVN